MSERDGEGGNRNANTVEWRDAAIARFASTQGKLRRGEGVYYVVALIYRL